MKPEYTQSMSSATPMTGTWFARVGIRPYELLSSPEVPAQPWRWAASILIRDIAA